MHNTFLLATNCVATCVLKVTSIAMFDFDIVLGRGGSPGVNAMLAGLRRAVANATLGTAVQVMPPVVISPPVFCVGFATGSAACSSSPTTTTPVAHGLFSATPTALYAHWYSGRKRVHRIARDLRYHPKFSVSNVGRNRYSRRVHFKTNRWNYREAYKDMP